MTVLLCGCMVWINPGASFIQPKDKKDTGPEELLSGPEDSSE